MSAAASEVVIDVHIASGAFLASAAGRRRVEDRALDAAWEAVRGRLRHLLGKDVTPQDATPTNLRALIDADADAKAALAQVGASAHVIRRATVVQRALQGARVLWIDDEPDGNALESSTLRAFGVEVRTALSGEEAKRVLRSERFDLVVSDISRPGESLAGIKDLPLLRLIAPELPVIFYIMRMEPRGVPSGAFGITARPDELLHLCMDALERRRL